MECMRDKQKNIELKNPFLLNNIDWYPATDKADEESVPGVWIRESALLL